MTSIIIVTKALLKMRSMHNANAKRLKTRTHWDR